MEMLKDEENIPARVGFIGGGLLGLLTAAIRPKRWMGNQHLLYRFSHPCLIAAVS